VSCVCRVAQTLVIGRLGFPIPCWCAVCLGRGERDTGRGGDVWIHIYVCKYISLRPNSLITDKIIVYYIYIVYQSLYLVDKWMNEMQSVLISTLKYVDCFARWTSSIPANREHAQLMWWTHIRYFSAENLRKTDP
jgi:hypothetical protein